MIVEMMVGGWLVTLGMIGLCALNESGKLLVIHRQIGRWLETLASPVNTTPKKGAAGPDKC